MSNLNSILKEFAEAQHAIELVPALRDEVRKEREDNNRLGMANSELTATITQLNETISALTQKVRSLEVDRDEASFRELVASDKLTSAQAALRTIIGNARELLEVNAEADKIAENDQSTEEKAGNEPSGQSATDPTEHSNETETGMSMATNTHIGDPKTEPEPYFTRQPLDIMPAEEPLRPFVESPESSQPGDIPQKPESTAAYSHPADPQTNATIPELPYAGMELWQKPSGITWTEFVNGGGAKPNWMI